MHFAQICSVCGQEHQPYYRDARVMLAKALGAEKYALCSCCGRPVEDSKDAGYRRKWKRWARRQKAQQRIDEARRKYEAEQAEEREVEIAREERALGLGRS